MDIWIGCCGNSIQWTGINLVMGTVDGRVALDTRLHHVKNQHIFSQKEMAKTFLVIDRHRSNATLFDYVLHNSSLGELTRRSK